MIKKVRRYDNISGGQNKTPMLKKQSADIPDGFLCRIKRSRPRIGKIPVCFYQINPSVLSVNMNTVSVMVENRVVSTTTELVTTPS